MLGLGEDPGLRGEGLGLGDPPSGDAADGKGEPDCPGDGRGKSPPGEGAGEAEGWRCVGGD